MDPQETVQPVARAADGYDRNEQYRLRRKLGEIQDRLNALALDADLRDRLVALLADWRAEAEAIYDECERKGEWGGYDSGRRAQLDRCADELERILKPAEGDADGD